MIQEIALHLIKGTDQVHQFVEHFNIYLDNDLYASLKPNACINFPLLLEDHVVKGIFGLEHQHFFTLKGKLYQYISKHELIETPDWILFSMEPQSFIRLLNYLWRSTAIELGQYDSNLGAILDVRDLTAQDFEPERF